MTVYRSECDGTGLATGAIQSDAIVACATKLVAAFG